MPNVKLTKIQSSKKFYKEIFEAMHHGITQLSRYHSLSLATAGVASPLLAGVIETGLFATAGLASPHFTGGFEALL